MKVSCLFGAKVKGIGEGGEGGSAETIMKWRW